MIAERNELYDVEYLGDYLLEDVYTESIHSKMSEEEEKLRIYIMNFIIDNGRQFDINDLTLKACEKANISYENRENTLLSIRDKGGLILEDNKVKFIYPVSSLPTSHKVTLQDGRSFHAMCAIDSLGSHFTFNQSIKIESKCSICKEEVKVQVENGEIKIHSPENIYILHADMKKFDNWGNSCWNIMNFFCREKHFETYVNNMNIDKELYFKLNIKDALVAAKMIFRVDN